MTTTAQTLTADYLRRLDGAAAHLPRAERDDLLVAIRNHFAEGLPPAASEAEVRTMIDDLGSPEAIVAAAGPPRPLVRRGPREIFAVALLLTGVPPGIGWVVGAGLLIWSPLWTWRQKLLGLLVWPGGLFAGGALIAGFLPSRSDSCSTGQIVGDPSTAVTTCTSSGPPLWVTVPIGLVLLLAPIVVGAYLWHAAARQSARP